METIPLNGLSSLAQKVLAKLPEKKESAALLALQGNLGAGKTTFVQALARELGVADVIQSPTYVLMKSYSIAYKGFTKLIHIDAYRLEKPEEFMALRPQSFLSDPHVLVCIEWPEKVEGILPTPDLTLRFSAEGAGDQERQVELQ